MDNEIGNTIARQIGDQAFMKMGTRGNMWATRNGLRFKIGRNSSQANWIQITLEPTDLYSIQFQRFTLEGGTEALTTVPGVFANQIHQVIESRTGLYLNL